MRTESLIVQHKHLDSTARVLRELDVNGTRCLEVMVTSAEHHHDNGDVVIWAKADTRTLFVPPTNRAAQLLDAIT